MLNEQSTFNHFFFSKISLFLFLFLVPFFLHSQSKTIFSYPTDTIVTKNGFLKKTYYLRGRPLNLSVMKWVMQDISKAKNNIQRAALSDQLSVAAYGFGGGTCFIGLIVLPDNRILGTKLLKYGGYSLGAGVLFQLLSTSYIKKAVLNFNLSLKEKASVYKIQLNFKLYPNKIGIGLQF